MRVVLAGQAYPPSTNGPAVFMANLAHALAARGHRVLVLAPSERTRSYEHDADGVRHVALPSVPIGVAGLRVTLHPGPAIDELFDAFGPDLVHIQDHYLTSRSVLRRARARGSRVVGTNHFLPENFALQFPWPLRSSALVHRVLWWTVGPLLQRLDAVAAPSRTAAGLLERRWPSLSVRPISCGVDLRRFRPRTAEELEEVRPRYGIDPARRLVLYVGRLDSDKSVDVLVRGWLRLARDDAQLALVGGGLDAGRLRALAEGAARPGSVLFTGKVPDDDLPLLYAAADVFAMPSTIELQSIATLEAMASGRPVVAADAGALPELVRDGETGLLIPAGDPAAMAAALGRLLDDRGARHAMGRRARVAVRSHAIERTAEAYERLYRCVLEGDEGGCGGPAEGGGERRRVVLTADDFGASADINRAVSRAHRAGTLTSTSLMVTGAAVSDAVALAREAPALAVGLHLVLVHGKAVSPPTSSPTWSTQAATSATIPCGPGCGTSSTGARAASSPSRSPRSSTASRRPACAWRTSTATCTCTCTPWCSTC